MTIKDFFANFYKAPEKRISLCMFFAGLATFFASAPFFLWPFLIIPLTLLADSLHNSQTTKQRIVRLCSFSAGYHLSNFHWIFFALTIDFEHYFFIPFCVILVCGALVIMHLVSAFPYLWIAKKIARTRYMSPFFTYFGVVLTWLILEIVKIDYPTGGLPWQGVGMIFAGNDKMLQIAYCIGIYGCHVLAALIATGPFLVIRHKYRKTIATALLLLCVSIFVYGHIRLRSAKEPTEFYDLPILGIQANIDIRTIKGQTENDQGVIKYIEDSYVASQIPRKNILLIWPESAIGAYSEFDLKHTKVLREIMKVLPSNTTHMIFGSLFFSQSKREFTNRISLVDNQGELLSFYDKIHLVPFGEYIPARKYAPRIAKRIVKGMIDIVPGKSYNIIEVGGAKFAPLICFESIFAKQIIKDKINEVDAILHISNDIWFGNSIGPYQHLAFAKMLSVAYRIPLIRVANSGISAYYNEYGVVQQSTLLNSSGMIYIPNLPKRWQNTN